jgi:hypothetical protein
MIDRETLIEKSIETYVNNQLFVIRSYPRNRITFLDAFPDNQRMTKPLDKNYIAIGWSADDGGKSAELGSPLTVRKYTFDLFTFGISRVWGKNIASVIRFCAESDRNIPLVDPADGVTVIDSVQVDFSSVQPQINRTPRPWEENCWITRLRVTDYYSSAGGG